MSGVLNDCDALLQAATVRILNPKNAFINLTPSGPGFHKTGAGVVDIATVTVTADLIALDGDIAFTVQGGTLSNVAARSVDVNYTSGTAILTATVVTNGETFARSCVIPVLRDGANGQPAYTWIKYADTAAGVGLSDDPTGKTYIGFAYNKSTATESTTATDYTWSLIKGTDGQPGGKGADGATLYTWIKYSDAADGTGLYDTPTASTLYIGIATNKSTATESTVKTDYVWSKFRGDQGVQGPTTYTWVKYADSSAGAGLSDDPTGKAYIGFAYNKSTAAESTTATDYTWSLIKGTDGQPGGKGADGQTLYTWIKYSDNADGTGLYDLPTASTQYLGLAVNKTTSTESTVKTDYVWSKFRGADGVGTAGARGAGHYYVAGSSWSDVVAQAACPGGPVVNDVVTISSGTFVAEKRWTGTAWVDNGVVINGRLIVPDSILSTSIDTRGLSVKKPDGSVILDAGSGRYSGAVAVSSLVVGTPDNIVPDPKFKDLAWWGRTGSVVAQFAEAGQSTGWKAGASIYLSKAAGELISYSEYFDLVPGATYRIEVQVGLSSDFNGRASVYLTIPGDRDYAMVDRSAGQAWADNMPVHLNSSSPKGIVTYSTTYTIPASGTLSKGRIQIRNSHTIGNVEVGSPSITRVADGSLVGDGVLEARHIIGDTLEVLAAKLGSVQLGVGGALWTGQTAYDNGVGLRLGTNAADDPYFSARSGNGNYVRIRPATNTFEWNGGTINGAQVINPQYAPFSVSAGADMYGSSRFNGVNFGTRTATIVGLDNLKSIQWTIDFDDRYGNFYLTNANTQTVGVTYSGPGGSPPFSGTATLTVTGIGKDGRIVSHSIYVDADVTG